MITGLLDASSCVFDHADPYAVAEYLNQRFGMHSIQVLTADRRRANLNHHNFASLDLSRISFGAGVRVTSPALNSIYRMQILIRGQCLMRSNNHEQLLVPGELLLINPDESVDITYSDNCEKLILKVPTGLIDSICVERRWHRPEHGVKFLQNRYPLDELKGFGHLLSVVCLEAEAEPSQLRVQEHFAQIVGAKMLTLMKTNVHQQTLGDKGGNFETILEYIENNIKSDLSGDDLAAQARIGVRSVYTLFDRYLGITPQQYIRQRKLESIHAILSDASCMVRNLTVVAMDHGFLHLGRFSDSYRRRFGELPSETLRRRP